VLQHIVLICISLFIFWLVPVTRQRTSLVGWSSVLAVTERLFIRPTKFLRLRSVPDWVECQSLELCYKIQRIIVIMFLDLLSLFVFSEVCNVDCIHGSCVKQRCLCDTGWTGLTCDRVECDRRCAVHGSCDNGTCLCRPGWNGRHCSLGDFYIYILLGLG